MKKNLLGAWSLAGTLLASTVHAVPQQDIAPGVAGTAGGVGVAGAASTGMFPFSDPRAVNLGAGIPVGGAILLTIADTANAPIVEVFDQEAPNITLGGTTRQLETSQYWIWVPSQPLVAGRTYQVRVSAPDVGVFGVLVSFEAVPAITLSQPRLVSEPSASAVAETYDTACCRQFFGAGVLQESSCFPSEQRRSIMLNPGLSTPDTAVLLGQFLFRIRPGDDTTSPAQPTPWPTAVPVLFYEQAQEYCFDVEAIELVSGTVHSYPSLARCAPHGQLPEAGVVAIEPGAAELGRDVCHAPPLAYEGSWCELNEGPCADDADASGCGLYGYVCRDEPLPADPFASLSGFAGFQGGFGGMVGVVGSGERGGDDGSSGLFGAAGIGGRSSSSSMTHDESNNGCTIASVPARGRGAGLLAWCAGAVAMLAAARYRRQACAGASSRLQ